MPAAGHVGCLLRLTVKSEGLRRHPASPFGHGPLADLDGDEQQRAERQGDRRLGRRQCRAAEHRLQRRRIGEGDLRRNRDGDADQTAGVPSTPCQVSAGPCT